MCCGEVGAEMGGWVPDLDVFGMHKRLLWGVGGEAGAGEGDVDVPLPCAGGVTMSMRARMWPFTHLWNPLSTALSVSVSAAASCEGVCVTCHQALPTLRAPPHTRPFRTVAKLFGSLRYTFLGN